MPSSATEHLDLLLQGVRQQFLDERKHTTLEQDRETNLEQSFYEIQARLSVALTSPVRQDRRDALVALMAYLARMEEAGHANTTTMDPSLLACEVCHANHRERQAVQWVTDEHGAPVALCLPCVKDADGDLADDQAYPEDVQSPTA